MNDQGRSLDRLIGRLGVVNHYLFCNGRSLCVFLILWQRTGVGFLSGGGKLPFFFLFGCWFVRGDEAVLCGMLMWCVCLYRAGCCEL